MTGTESAPEAEVIDREQLTPMFHVVLLDDDEHSYAYVIDMLQHLFLFSEG
jgi:ATP-dependent Clp protease adaptor protein ClpS